MFGLFSKKKYKPSVTLEDKEWLEKNINWFIQVFGLEKLKEEPFIYPTVENFPYEDLTDLVEFEKLFEQICKYWDINPNEIIVTIFDDFKSKEWTTWIPQGQYNEATGLYNQIYTLDEKRFKIQIAKSNLKSPQGLVSVIAHELAHVKLLGGNYINSADNDMEQLTDLATIYFGFGVFIANTCQTQDVNWMGRSGYLPNQLISYTNALICYITGNNPADYLSQLNYNTSDLFKQDYDFLVNTNDTILTKYEVSESESKFKITESIIENFKNRNFNEVIIASKAFLKIHPNDVVFLNNIGYALLQQKKYKEAIEEFNIAIGINAYHEYPYNNRGYCKLQLGYLESALIDINHSMDMNPENSFAWRNLGAYYLRIDEFEKALLHFEEAEKMDPKTELINFYLGKVNLKMGNTEKSNLYLEKSIKINEYNDSIID